MSKKNQYFAQMDSKDTANELLTRAQDFMKAIYGMGYMEKLESSWMAYHGMTAGGLSDSHKITMGGEQGELTNINVNHYRSIAANIITMVTASRPKLQARSINTDAKSLTQATLANGLLDYYLREKRLERFLKSAVESAIIYGSGYVKMDWDATSGDVVDYEDDGTPIYLGDIVYSNVSPFDVFYDTTKDSNQAQDWILVRSFKNKFDLAAKFQDQENDIISLATKEEMLRMDIKGMFNVKSEDIPVYEFYHRRTPSMPSGRYMLFADHDVVLMDTEMPYRDLPVYRITPGEIVGTSLGYTPMFDLLNLQDAINILYSTVFTNNYTFGVQNIISPRGADVDFTQLSGGMNFIEYNQQAGGKPEALQLTQSSPEAYKLIEMLERNQETISGVNSVARGNPDSSLKTGSALAMVQAMALQFISGLQQQYIQLIEDCGSGTINMLKDFAAEKRVAVIVGESNKTYVKTFTRDDLLSVGRVIVDVGNPLSATHAGKLEIANQLLQYQLLKTPQQYLTLMQTGSLDLLTEEVNREQFLLKDENEAMLHGETVTAIFTDDHIVHINSHKNVLNDVRLRRDPELVKLITDHIQEHIDLLRGTDPQILQAMGQTPLAPAGGTPSAIQDPNAQVTNSAGPEAAPEGQAPMMPQTPVEAAGINMPNMPNMPAMNDPRQIKPQ